MLNRETSVGGSHRGVDPCSSLERPSALQCAAVGLKMIILIR